MAELVRRDGNSVVIGNMVLKSMPAPVVSRRLDDSVEYERRLAEIQALPREKRAAARLKLIDELGA